MTSLQNRCGYFNNNSVWIFMSDTDYAAVELYTNYPNSLLMFASVCYVISMIIGIPGNLITIIALANYKKVHNATALFIVNMSCADLLLLCLDPPLITSTYWRRYWIHGRVFCHLYALAKYILISASICTVMAITINRYILIIHPRLYFKIYRTRNLTIMLAAIWITPLLALIPTFLGKWGCFGLDLEYGPCAVVPDQNNRSSKKFLFISALGLPCIPIILCYTRIFFKVRKTTKKSHNTKWEKKTRSSNFEGNIDNSEDNRQYIPLELIADLKTEQNQSLVIETPSGTSYNKDEKLSEPTEVPRISRNILKRSMRFLNLSLPRRKDKRLGTMIVAIMTSFCLCHFPTVITAMLRGITPHPVLNVVSHILLCLSCCLNPVIYVVMSNEYQKAYKNLFRCQNFIKKSVAYFCG